MNKGSKQIGVGLIVLVAIAAITMIPGAWGSLAAAFTGEPQSCMLAPYTEDCTCADGYRKIDVPWNGLPRWNCEELEALILDPESPTFEQDSITFARQYLTSNCGSVCTDLACEDGSVCNDQGEPTYPDTDCIAVVYDWGVTGQRIVNIECNVITQYDSQGRPESGYTPWRMEFFVVGATEIPSTYELYDNYCVNPAMTERCEPPMNTVPLQSVFGLIPIQLGSTWPAPV